MAYADRIFAAPYISLADVDEAVARARMGARPRGPHRRHAGRGADHGDGAALAGRRRVRPLLGPGERGRHHRGRARRRRRALLQRLRARRLLGLVPRRPGPAEHQDVRHRAGGPRLPGHPDPREALRPLPQPAHRVGRERLRVPGPAVQEDAHDGQAHARLFRRGSRRHLPPPRVDQSLLGGRRQRDRRPHGRRPGDLRVGLAAHRRDCPSRPTGRRSCRSCRPSRWPRSWAATCPSSTSTGRGHDGGHRPQRDRGLGALPRPRSIPTSSSSSAPPATWRRASSSPACSTSPSRD